MKFVQILENIAYQVGCETERRYNDTANNIPFQIKLRYAIQFWSFELGFSEPITQYILDNSKLSEVKDLTEYIWKESTTKKKDVKIQISVVEVIFFQIDNEFYSRINSFLYCIPTSKTNMKLIVIIAFVVTAVGYCLYVINRQKEQTQQPQQPTRRTETRPNQYISTSPSTLVQTPPVQRIKHFLVLVISASQTDFINSLLAKKRIDFSDGEQLYELTKYLWTGSDSDIDFKQRISNINSYIVSPGQESEYDIYLVFIELQRKDSGFHPKVNQLDRIDAFRKLSDLTVDFQISPRLQMEAYGNFEVYSN
jgi:hypothetical protein